MAYTDKFQQLADDAIAQVDGVRPEDVDSLIADGAIALDIRDKEEHDADHIAGSHKLSRGKRDMLVEDRIPDLDPPIMCFCNAVNRGALSAAAL